LKWVAVTGWGVISPIGLKRSHLLVEPYIAGRSGIGPITLASSERLRQKSVAEFKDFDPDDRLP